MLGEEFFQRIERGVAIIPILGIKLVGSFLKSTDGFFVSIHFPFNIGKSVIVVVLIQALFVVIEALQNFQIFRDYNLQKKVFQTPCRFIIWKKKNRRSDVTENITNLFHSFLLTVVGIKDDYNFDPLVLFLFYVWLIAVKICPPIQGPKVPIGNSHTEGAQVTFQKPSVLFALDNDVKIFSHCQRRISVPESSAIGNWSAE